MGLSPTIIITIAALTIFLAFITGLKYAVEDEFTRTRLMMTSFFFFIVVTLTTSFWQYTLHSLWYTVPAALVGMIIGHIVAVREAERRVMAEGLNHYLEHFAHVHSEDLKQLRWWAIINFYSVMGALVLINFVGLSTVIFSGHEEWAMVTCAVGAFLLGTIVPYIAHLWSISAQNAKARAPHSPQEE